MADFPQSVEDLQAMIDLGFKSVNGAFLIEELFNREIEDEEDDDTKAPLVPPPSDIPEEEKKEEVKEEEAQDSGPAPEEVLEKNKLSARVERFENIIKINQLVKKNSDAQVRNCIVQRLKFKSPMNPVGWPKLDEEGLPIEGSSTPEEDAERERQEKIHNKFAVSQRKIVDGFAQSLQEYKHVKSSLENAKKPFWPLILTKEEQLRLKEQELMDRDSKMKEQRE